MHILQLLPSLEVGGVERGTLDLAKGLMARGHRVSVVSSGGALVEPLTQLGAAHYQLPVHRKSPVVMWQCVPALAQLITEHQVDIVHARSRVPAWIGWAAVRRTQRPFITTAHGFYRPHPTSRIMVWGRYVIAPSEALGRYLVERFQLPKARLRVIPRGVDLTTFAFRPPAAHHEGPWRIGLFGRLSAIKGHEVAVRACARLQQQGQAIRVCIAGDAPGSPIRLTLERLIDSLELHDAVEWLGVRHDVPDLIASVDIVVVPSVYPESFGRSVIEAQAVGRPVVASAIGAMPDLIEDGANGLLVRPNDPRALADALARAFGDEPLRARCVAEGRTRVAAQGGVDRMVEQTLQVYDECLTKPRVLIWKLSALGDVVLATPSLRAIRRHVPGAHVTLVVGRGAYEVVARCPYVDEILLHDPKRKDRGVRRQWRWLRRLRRGAYDLSVDLQNSRKTHLLAWLAGIPVRIGYRRKWGWLLNRAVRLPRVVLAPIAHQQYLLTQAGLSVDGEALELWPSAHDAQAVERFFPAEAAQAPTVALHPGGSGRWRTKRWDLGRWAQLCDALAGRGIRVIVTGGPDERALAAELKPLLTSQPMIAIGQTSVLELASVIKRCQVFVGHDSSPLHLATAMGTPSIALFGPTDPRRHLASTFTGQVLTHQVFCSPCYSPRCRTITHACMKGISVEDVLRAVLTIVLHDPSIT